MIKRREKKKLYILIPIIILISIIVFFPFIMMIITSLKSMTEIRSAKFVFFPEKLLWSNYITVLKSAKWGRFFLNSFIVTITSVVISLIINSMAGYTFARLKFPGRDFMFILSLFGMMMPAQVIMLPCYVIMKYVPFAGGNNIFGIGGKGFLDSYAGLIVPHIAGSFGVFLFRQFLLNFPESLDDAAKIDGLSKFKIYLKIYLPLSKPVIATLIVLKFTATWNDYIWPLLIAQRENLRTVQLSLAFMNTDYDKQWNQIMAATTMITLPVALLFLFLQKYFIQGVVSSGIKG
jgi:multiple sugar transport system permease protein